MDRPRTALCQPDCVHWCDGSNAEDDEMLRLMVHAGGRRPDLQTVGVGAGQ